MHYTECKSMEELPELNQKYDAFVCGSDVIWNFSYTFADECYFLNFANQYKFSYAASFGKADIHYEFETVRLSENPENVYKRNINTLDSVSVREKEAVAIAQHFTSKEVVQVCDPVLLLTKSEWSSICQKTKKINKPYIFAYNTSDKPIFTWFLDKIKSDTGLRVIHVTWEVSDAIKEGAFMFPPPQEWLALLKDAEYVVTNSFHATAFATVFQKKFYTVMQDGREARTNIRIYDFLENLGLVDRIVNNREVQIQYVDPDFTLSEEVIKRERENGFQFLQDNLEAAFKREEEKRLMRKL